MLEIPQALFANLSLHYSASNSAPASFSTLYPASDSTFTAFQSLKVSTLTENVNDCKRRFEAGNLADKARQLSMLSCAVDKYSQIATDSVNSLI